MQHQPQKVMAMEGHYESHPDGWAPFYLFGIPNDAEQRLDYAVGIPGASSLILNHSLSAPLAGLDTIPDDEQPPVFIVFWSFRIMVGLGMLMVGLGAWSLWARWRGTLYDNRLLHRCAVAMGPSGLVAVLAGWVTTEVGRQPYTVWGLLRTADSAAPLDATAVGASLVAFVVVYFIVFGAGTFYLLRLMAYPPASGGPEDWEEPSGPIRTAGIAPGPAQGAPLDRRQRSEEEAR
jgi:cytochrome d ubiquinol oxidase subunit I